MNSNYSLFRLFGIFICCISGIAASEAIIGGLLASKLEYRYHVIILYPSQKTTCGGGIIGPYLAITAAHCVLAHNWNRQLIDRSISVLVGTNDLMEAGEVIDVERIYVPQVYEPENPHSSGDIALLKLHNVLPMERRQLKKLNLALHKKSSEHDGQKATITGFGWDYVTQTNPIIGKHTDERLRFADAEILSHNQCQEEHPNIVLAHDHICAKIKQITPGRQCGVCYGDSGGPLVINGQAILGILSATAYGCSETNSSGLYIRVSFYRSAIQRILVGKNPVTPMHVFIV